ncbi:hypothetical protein FB192DRAFT_1461372 [Mucor lusitanicus]|uniref:Uncharacterized protein n=2 Tax=Mucor circinelloides f. lusitanicus TaxID=29924 RepID=A0A168LD55_MUCCL|nr:hypothetical protein FB192DRAFT_1461372 [Mucor lusitanicus]OAD03388.1 hypothetical protein MUCCIDRAFT_110247 [Mucor lusitanicus CBS 277.49]
MESVQQNDNQVSSYQNGSKINAHLETSNHTSVQNSQQQVNWITCNDNAMTEEAYDCESRPLMTVLLIVSILVLLFLRKSSLIRNWVSSHQEKLSQENQTDEEEGLMQRVV